MAFHAEPAHAVAARLGVDVQRGLDAAEVERRRAEAGPNRIASSRRVAAWRRFAAHFTDLFVLLLLAAAAVSVALGETHDVAAILAIVLLNAVLGFVHERRTERTLEALRGLAPPQARARRSGRTVRLDAVELVPGDVVHLEAGDLVPADMRLVEVRELRTSEAALTGESAPVAKSAEASNDPGLPVADRRSMAFKGTHCVHGAALGVVTATGMETELGRIAALLQEVRGVDTPLQRSLAHFARRTAAAVGVLCAVLFAWGLARGEPAGLMLLTAVSLAVAAIPEALPAMSTLTLSLGARRMARRNALVRHLPAVEALGGVTWICTDKTGTLTENRMRVRAWRSGDVEREAPPPDAERDRAWRALLDAAALNAEVQRDEGGAWIGDPTEVALVEAAERHGVARDEAEQRRPRVATIAFSSDRGRMTTVHGGACGGVAFVKGSPESVIERCRLAEDARAAALAAAGALARRGLRVLAFAVREPVPPGAELERDLELLGLVGLLDPPRAGARDAVRQCREAGIHVAMVTGDHPATALAIARELDLADEDTIPVTGRELIDVDDAELRERTLATTVFARVAPEQKIAIVRALQEHGEHVAMTGDGVNDAPALRRADIGVAMGAGGTDVAREAASIVLLDDDFATIVSAVREGRRIDDNLRKFVEYALTGNMGEIVAIAAAPLFGLPLPLLPLQILWVNLVTDGLPGLALGLEEAEGDVMRRPPRAPGRGLLTRRLAQRVLAMGLVIGAASLVGFGLAGSAEPARARTFAFTVLTFAQLGHVLAIRSRLEPLWSRAALRSPALHATVAGTASLQLAALYVPFLASALGAVPLALGELALCLALASLAPLAVELEKALRRRRRGRRDGRG